MPGNAYVAALALAIAVAHGSGVWPAAFCSECPNRSSNAVVQRTVVMFGFTTIRRHLLDTLTELVGRSHSPLGAGALPEASSA